MPEKKASVSFDALMRQLKNGEFAPVYLLMGDEPYYIDKLSNFFQNQILIPEQQAFDLTVVLLMSTRRRSLTWRCSIR